jgi:hypothetical protein
MHDLIVGLCSSQLHQPDETLTDTQTASGEKARIRGDSETELETD